MAFLSARLSRGKKYWSICESRRVNGKPKNIPIEYLGTVDTLFKRIHQEDDIVINTYSHGDTSRLGCVVRKKGSKVKYQLEKISDDLKKIASILKISDK